VNSLAIYLIENEIAGDNLPVMGIVALSGLAAGNRLHFEIHKFCV
jgi:hypothetical protein